MVVELYTKHRTLKNLPVYEDTNGYVLDHETINDLFTSYLNEVNKQDWSQEILQEEQERFKQELEHAKQELLNIVIDADELRHYLRRPEPGPTIQKYTHIKDELGLRLVEYVQTIESVLHDDHDYTEWDMAELASTNQQRQVLNKNNPFADITIQTQQYITPDSEGNFQTLSFMTGYTMTKLDVNDQYAIALQPGFKVTKSTNRTTFNNDSNIAMDNTLTTPMPEKRNERDLIYI